MRSSARRPRYGEESRLVTHACSGAPFGVGRRRDALEEDVDERRQILAGDLALDDRVGFVEVERRPAVAAGAVDDWELDLVFAGIEIEEEFVDLVDDFGSAGVRAIDLVDRQNDRQVASKCLAEDEAGLRQRAFSRVDEQHDAVDHCQGTLDFATEVGVAGGVDDVERDLFAAGLVVPHE